MPPIKAIRNRFLARRQAFGLYTELVSAARQPVFHDRFQVPDTLDGRFDMILIHLALMVRRLGREGGASGDQRRAGRHAQRLTRHVQEAFVTDMDRSLREMGVGDMSIGKQVQAMGEAWFGRLQAYSEALDAGTGPLAAALERNLYRGDNAPGAEPIAHYMAMAATALDQMPLADLTARPGALQAAFPPADSFPDTGSGDPSQ
ncbi:ubiquinol-cytochrome C chaperone family protein [Yunchengibacter salinarum]|uniref:ubiquinol-cytochrome C chaperone family protein n=1 Tax=Yunchengibacter salinarum TaxID=3133399 RepID=UPI0035B67D8D